MPGPFPILSRNRVEVALERRLTEQQALAKLSLMALEMADPLAVMQQAVERVAAIQEVELVSISEQIGPNEIALRAVFDSDKTFEVGTKYELDVNTPAGYVIAKQTYVLVNDLRFDPRFNSEYALAQKGMISGINVNVPCRGGIWGTLGVWTKDSRTFTSDDVHFIQAVANVIGGLLTRGEVESRLAEAVRHKDRQLRHEQAIGQCARALLGDFDTKALESSLRALMDATHASFGYIDWQRQPESKIEPVRLGPDGDRSADLDSYWSAVSWDQLPTIRDRVSFGESTAFKISDLPLEEGSILTRAPVLIASEVDVPIVVDGAWAGTLGLASSNEDREWDSEEAMTLEVVASLIGSWWERRVYAEKLEAALESLNRRLRLEQAVAAASQFLSRSTDPVELDDALAALLDGTDATSVFVERNVKDPKRGLCSRVVAVAKRPGATYNPDYWNMMPWSQMPLSYERLSKGKEVVLNPDTWKGALEEETYARSGLQSEIDVPIVVDGKWEGLIGLSDELAARTWYEEIEMLRTAADVIASYWARANATEKLEALMRSKDEFIASISHELRTPLTAVVGLAEAITDPHSGIEQAEADEFMKIIAEQSAEMSAIVQDLLVVARSDIGRVTIRLEQLNLVAEVEAAMRGLRRERRADVEITGESFAFADPIRVRQILRNLLTNADRYGGATIKVRIEQAGDFGRVRVMDNGLGIPIEHRERIFQPYERAHQRLGQPAAVGLGLTVSRQLAVLMGGSLIYDHDQGWSTFTLDLPAV